MDYVSRLTTQPNQQRIDRRFGLSLGNFGTLIFSQEKEPEEPYNFERLNLQGVDPRMLFNLRSHRSNSRYRRSVLEESKSVNQRGSSSRKRSSRVYLDNAQEQSFEEQQCGEFISCPLLTETDVFVGHARSRIQHSSIPIQEFDNYYEEEEGEELSGSLPPEPLSEADPDVDLARASSNLNKTIPR